MIRPFTCVCFLLACASGLYLYQAKHRVQVIDREIQKTVRVTEELRERIRILHAEWTLQNDPQRLQGLADQLLALKTVTPGQFTNLAELGNRLPAVRAPEPPPADPLSLVIAHSTPNGAPTTAPTAAPIEEPRPVPAAPPPPRPAVAVMAAASAPRAEPRPVPRPAPVVARPVAAAIEQARPIVPAAASASALGMARGTSLPPPTPMPFPRWYENGGGG